MRLMPEPVLGWQSFEVCVIGTDFDCNDSEYFVSTGLEFHFPFEQMEVLLSPLF